MSHGSSMTRSNSSAPWLTQNSRVNDSSSLLNGQLNVVFLLKLRKTPNVLTSTGSTSCTNGCKRALWMTFSEMRYVPDLESYLARTGNQIPILRHPQPHSVPKLLRTSSGRCDASASAILLTVALKKLNFAVRSNFWGFSSALDRSALDCSALDRVGIISERSVARPVTGGLAPDESRVLRRFRSAIAQTALSFETSLGKLCVNEHR